MFFAFWKKRRLFAGTRDVLGCPPKNKVRVLSDPFWGKGGEESLAPKGQSCN